MTDESKPVGRAAARAAGRMRIVPPDPRGIGIEPDYRFTLANERTFLAWVRTALALVAGGLASISVLDFRGSDGLGLLLLGLGVATAGTSFHRWAANERAMRLDEPLPASRLPQLMAAGTALVALVAAILLLVNEL